MPRLYIDITDRHHNELMRRKYETRVPVRATVLNALDAMFGWEPPAAGPAPKPVYFDTPARDIRAENYMGVDAKLTPQHAPLTEVEPTVEWSGVAREDEL